MKSKSTPEVLSTHWGEIPYTLTHKRVRNLNLRIRSDGTVHVSAPMRTPRRYIDTFLATKTDWILENRKKMLEKAMPLPSVYTKEQCLAIYTAVSDSIFPLFSDVLGGEKPTLKVREMRTRWGVCNLKTRTITLNTRLADKPRAALEYVVLHEYVLFTHPNHQAGFHAEMARLMPDYKQRRKLLK